MRTSKVWAVKENVVRSATGSVAMDYSPALQFGELDFITQADLPFHQKSTVWKDWAADVRRFVEEYNPVQDFLICPGQPMAILMVGFALGSAGKSPRFLVWRREENRYLPVAFDMMPVTSLNFE